jgi:hypothetical protein
MTPYDFHEGQFRISGPVLDATVNSLIYKTPRGPVRLFVARFPRTGGTLDAFVDERTTQQRRRLMSFRIEAQAERVADGERCLEVTTSHVEDGLEVVQRQASFFARERALMVGASGPAEARGEIDALFEHAVGRLSIRRDEPQA